MLHFCPLHLTRVLRPTRVRSSNRSIVPFYSVHCLRVRAEYTNQHLRNCLMDVVPGTTDSAVAKRATSENVRTVFIMYLTLKQLTVHTVTKGETVYRQKLTVMLRYRRQNLI